jgi:hypothetical protein
MRIHSKLGTLAAVANVNMSASDSEPDEAKAPQKSLGKLSELTSSHRRYCLVETAKASLHAATYPSIIQKSFKITRIYPLDLKQALQRDGMRDTPNMQSYHDNIQNSVKRGCISINGVVLTRRDSIEMMREADRVKNEKSKPKRKKKKESEEES